MKENSTRREVLKNASAASGIAILGSINAQARNSGNQPSVRVIEAGIRYDVPDRSDYDRLEVDSRPAFTVDEKNNRFVVDSRSKVGNDIESLEAYINEKKERKSNKTKTIGARKVKSLSTTLTSRKRPGTQIVLESAHKLPKINIHWNSNGSAVNIQSKGRIQLSTGSSKEIELEPETINVQTYSKVEADVDIPGTPSSQIGHKFEFGSAEVEATPIIEIVDHGELDAVLQELA